MPRRRRVRIGGNPHLRGPTITPWRPSATSSSDGRRALEEARWRGGPGDLRGGPGAARSPPPRVRDSGLALWFLGEIAEAIASREHAFGLYADAGSCDDAARTAVWVSHQHYIGGRTSAARGWLARAERTLEGHAGLRRSRLGGRRASPARRPASPIRSPTPRGPWRSPGATAPTTSRSSRSACWDAPRCRAGQRRARHGAARGGDGRRVRRAGAQRAHPGRGLLQPDHGLHQRGGVGARDRVVRARRRVRPH